MLSVEFKGIGLGLLTHVGPDSGLVRCEITRVDGDTLQRSEKTFSYQSYCLLAELY